MERGGGPDRDDCEPLPGTMTRVPSLRTMICWPLASITSASPAARLFASAGRGVQDRRCGDAGRGVGERQAAGGRAGRQRGAHRRPARCLILLFTSCNGCQRPGSAVGDSHTADQNGRHSPRAVAHLRERQQHDGGAPVPPQRGSGCPRAAGRHRKCGVQRSSRRPVPWQVKSMEGCKR